MQRITTSPTGWSEEPPSSPTLITDNLVIRPISADDAEALAPIRNQDSVRYGLNRGNTVTVSGLRSTLVEAAGLAALGVAYACAITLRSTAKPIGLIEFEGVNPHAKSATLTVWLDENERKNGYGLEACCAFIKWGLDELPLDRVDGWIRADNRAALSLVTRLGFAFHAPGKAQNSQGDEIEIAIYFLTRAKWSECCGSALPSSGPKAP